MEKKVIIELSLKQLDDLLSNRISKMKPVVYFIMDNVEDKEQYLRKECSGR